ncbi:zwei Ig domain protein zig-8-like [Hyalella azteca]|uniref:Zwei Ig domain protein zig-8-like n=1 Tax=Hyalella azteca TaxID=294128 RepID=A0A8B7P869_HYAAZ|nr:zwei Ig domain protein zig-8-like [Hyalella azteca]
MTPQQLLLLLLTAATLVGGSEWKEETDWDSSKWAQLHATPKRGPAFLPGLPTRVLTTAGNNATLPCRLANLRRRTVSWIRQADLQVLTLDVFTFTSDSRFSIKSTHPSPNSVHTGSLGSWDLRIRDVSQDDTGVYLCQINTRPTLVHAVTLSVADGLPRISGPREVYLHAGSRLLLSCWLLAPPHPPPVVWSVNGTLLNTSADARWVARELNI